MTEQVESRVTAAAFFQLPESNQIIELLHGEIVITGSQTLIHQRVLGKAITCLNNGIPNGQVYVAPLDVYLDESNVVQPDVFWVSDENTACIPVEGTHYTGAPDLCVEVLSPSTLRRDRTVKFLLYEQFGVREYWMIDPETATLEVWVLDGGKYTRQGIYGPNAQFTASVLGGVVVAVSAFFD